MRKLKKYVLERKPFELPLLTYRDRIGEHTIAIYASKLDRIDVFREKEKTYVLAWNQGVEYATLYVFFGEEELGQVVENHRGLEVMLGKKTADFTPLSIAKGMAREYEAKDIYLRALSKKRAASGREHASSKELQRRV